MFLIRYLYKFIILCSEIYCGFHVTKIIIITITLITCNSYFCQFLKLQWLHITGVVDKVITDYAKL